MGATPCLNHERRNSDGVIFLLPLKQEIYDVQAHQRKIQRDATNLKHGKPTEFEWDWPEEVTSVRRRSARRSVGRRGAAELEIGGGEGGVV